LTPERSQYFASVLGEFDERGPLVLGVVGALEQVEFFEAGDDAGRDRGPDRLEGRQGAYA
jgi:hypothetical protein